MSEQKPTPPPAPVKSGNKATIIIALLSIIVIIQSIKIYMDYQRNVEKTVQMRFRQSLIRK
jgi:hypothetical protein